MTVSAPQGRASRIPIVVALIGLIGSIGAAFIGIEVWGPDNEEAIKLTDVSTETQAAPTTTETPSTTPGPTPSATSDPNPSVSETDPPPSAEEPTTTTRPTPHKIAISTFTESAWDVDLRPRNDETGGEVKFEDDALVFDWVVSAPDLESFDSSQAGINATAIFVDQCWDPDTDGSFDSFDVKVIRQHRGGDSHSDQVAVRQGSTVALLELPVLRFSETTPTEYVLTGNVAADLIRGDEISFAVGPEICFGVERNTGMTSEGPVADLVGMSTLVDFEITLRRDTDS